jgi:CubicO group peptidase (beta-lactamase class C family)
LSDPTSDREVTIRDLLCHRTGVPEYANEWSGVFRTVDQVDLLKRLRKHKPTKPFRAEFQYNNLTFLAAGYAAGKADDSTWEDSVQKRILTPLGMTGATLSVKTMQQRPNHAKPHKSGKGENKGMVVKIPFFDVDHVGPAGSINASARDMSQWLRFMLAEGEIDGRRLVPIKHAREMVKPHVVVPVPSAVPEEFSVNRNYALGMFVRDYRGHKLFEHTGGINGFRSYIIMVPRAKIGIIVLCNRECDCHAALGLQLTDKLLGLPAVGWTDHYKKLKK